MWSKRQPTPAAAAPRISGGHSRRPPSLLPQAIAVARAFLGSAPDFTVEPLFTRAHLGSPLEWTGALPSRLVERLGRASALWCGRGRVFIGRDTRASGVELEEAFARGDEIQTYIEKCYAEMGIADHVRFEQEVLSTVWDKNKGVWNVKVRRKDGSTYEDSYHAVISAAGLLNVPTFPKIPGIDRFKGPLFHAMQATGRSPQRTRYLRCSPTGRLNPR